MWNFIAWQSLAKTLSLIYILFIFVERTFRLLKFYRFHYEIYRYVSYLLMIFKNFFIVRVYKRVLGGWIWVEIKIRDSRFKKTVLKKLNALFIAKQMLQSPIKTNDRNFLNHLCLILHVSWLPEKKQLFLTIAQRIAEATTEIKT